MKKIALLFPGILLYTLSYGQIKTSEIEVINGQTTTFEDDVIANGMVGIGTPNPVYDLQVEGSTFIRDYLKFGATLTTSSIHSVPIIGSHTDKTLMLIGRGTAPDDIAFYTYEDGATVTEAMRIKASTQQVGIGTSSPASTLHVAGATQVDGSIYVNTNGDSPISFNNTDNSWQYMQFLRNGTRYTWMGMHSGNDFVITKEQGGDIVLYGANVGIGTYSPSYKLDINGSIRYTSGGLNGSDRRWKKDITPISGASEIINRINPVGYYWNSEEFRDKNFDNRMHYGVIAQELELILPELVETDAEGFKSVEYTSLIALLVKALQEKEIQISNLEKKVDLLAEVISERPNQFLGNKNFDTSKLPETTNQ